jgi:FkbM family methyltransferase
MNSPVAAKPLSPESEQRESAGSVPIPAAVFRALFEKRRPRGYMRLGSWAARLFPSMQQTRLQYQGTSISLDLRRIDHQTTFLDGAGTFESDERRLLEEIVPAGGTAIDVGANIGLFTLSLAKLVGPTGLVISYEPDSQNLLTNTAAFSQVQVRPVAVSDKEEQVTFRLHRSSSLSRIVPKSARSMKDLSIDAVTLDAEKFRHSLTRIDFLKIDVEGAEANVLAGAPQLLSDEHAPVIMFEWIPGFRGRWQKSALAVLKDSVGDGWRLFRVGWNQPVAEIKNFAEPETEANIFAFPPNRSLALQRFLDAAGLLS